MTRNPKLTCGLMAGATLWTVLRTPGLLFQHPRFWAEEGGDFFSNALALPWWQSIVHPHMGYYNFSAAVSAELATVVPLASAPLVTTWIALLLQLVPVWLVATSNLPVFQAPAVRALGVLALLVVPDGEVWLNTVNSQFFLTIGAALILAETWQAFGTPRPSWSRRIVLLGAGLSGVVPAFLLPLWIWLTVSTRGRETKIRLAIVLACAALQAAVAVGVTFKDDLRGTDRLKLPHPGTASLIATNRLAVEPVLGIPAARWVLDVAQRNGVDTPGVRGLGIAAAALGAAGLWILTRGSRIQPLAWAAVLIFGGSVCAAFVSKSALGGLLDPDVFGRYFVVPNSLLLLALLEALARAHSEGRTVRFLVVGTVFVAILATGLVAFRRGVEPHPGYPDWHDEVARAAADPGYSPECWPGGFPVELTRTASVTASVTVLNPWADPDRPGPTLSATRPVLGLPITIRITGASPGASGYLFLDGEPLSTPAPSPEVPGAQWWLPRGESGDRSVPFTCGSDGVYSSEFPLAEQGMGQVHSLQARFDNPVPNVTNALKLVLGDR